MAIGIASCLYVECPKQSSKVHEQGLIGDVFANADSSIAISILNILHAITPSSTDLRPAPYAR